MFRRNDNNAIFLKVEALHTVTFFCPRHGDGKTECIKIKEGVRSQEGLSAVTKLLRSRYDEHVGNSCVRQQMSITLCGIINDKMVEALDGADLEEFERHIETISFESDPKRRRWAYDLRAL